MLRAGRTTVVIEVRCTRRRRRQPGDGHRHRDDELRRAPPPRHQSRHHRGSADGPSTMALELRTRRAAARAARRRGRRRGGGRHRGAGRSTGRSTRWARCRAASSVPSSRSRRRPRCRRRPASRSSSATCRSRTSRSAGSGRCARGSTCSAHRDARGRARRARRHGRREPAADGRARRRDKVARVTQTPANMGPTSGGSRVSTCARPTSCTSPGDARVVDHLRGRTGAVRAGALLTMLDNVGGVCGGLAALPDGWVVSTNLAARTCHRAHRGPLRLDSDVLRRGRNNVVTAVRDPRRGRTTRSSPTACSRRRSSFPRTDRRSGNVRSASAITGARRTTLPPMHEWLGARALDDATRSRSTSPTTLRNPWGILHGGVVATLVDLAAEHATGGGHAPTSCCTSSRRTASARCAPHARSLGRRSDGDVVPRRGPRRRRRPR